MNKSKISMLALLAVCGMANSAQAGGCGTTNIWTPGNGDFDDPAEWSLVSVPDSTEVARFYSIIDPMPYTVDFNDDEESCQLLVQRALVTFDAPVTRYTYTLYSTGVDETDASFVVAHWGPINSFYDPAELTLIDMDVVGQDGFIGNTIHGGGGRSRVTVLDSSLVLSGNLTIGDSIGWAELFINEGIRGETTVSIGGTLQIGREAGLGGSFDGRVPVSDRNSFGPGLDADEIIVGGEYAYGHLVIDGGSVSTSTNVLVDDMGWLLGDHGDINGDVEVEGVVAPGLPSVPLLFGELDFFDDLEFTSSSYYLVDIEDADHDALDIVGDVTLSGTLVVTLDSGADPAAGTTYEIITASNRTGTFTTHTLPTFTDCRTIKVRYCSDRVVLIVAGTLGDVNYDGVVDADDQNLVLTNYSQTGCVVAGDADFDGDVDFADLNIVINNISNVCN